jgi:DNA-binding response OmpR family regulator
VFVLIVDSDWNRTHATQEAFKGAGIETEVRTRTEGILEHVKQSRPEAIVIAANLDEISGLQARACWELKNSVHTRRIPLVVTSPRPATVAFTVHKMREERAEAYLEEPYRPSTLVALVQPYLGKSDTELAAMGARELETEKRSKGNLSLRDIVVLFGLFVIGAGLISMIIWESF